LTEDEPGAMVSLLEGCFSPQFKALDLNLWTKAQTQKHGGMVSSVKGDKKDQYFSIL